MSSVLENFQKRNFMPTRPFSDDLPISTTQTKTQPSHLRKRLITTLSLKMQPLSSSACAAASWSFRRTKSMSSIGELAGGSLRRWWDWGVGWFMSRKPSFASDLEMNEEESAMLGFHSKGTWRHLLYKMRSGLRKMVGCDGGGVVKEKRFGYNSFSYRQNFDDDVKRNDEL